MELFINYVTQREGKEFWLGITPGSNAGVAQLFRNEQKKWLQSLADPEICPKKLGGQKLISENPYHRANLTLNTAIYAL